MDDTKIRETAEYREMINMIGGSYAQAKYFLSALPPDIAKRLYSDSRKKQDVQIRSNVITLLRDKYKLTFPAIAELLKYADHTSVMHHYHKRYANVGKDKA